MSNYPVRAGIFTTSASAMDAVNRLHDAGFTWDQISVVCSDKAIQKLFPQAIHHVPSQDFSSTALDYAATGVMGFGGAAIALAMVSGPGMIVAVLGAFAGVAAAGTFATLMATRGFESEATDYYEQALQEGNILVTVEISDAFPDAATRRETAESLLSAAGGEVQMLSH